jgi:hypothetical protein
MDEASRTATGERGRAITLFLRAQGFTVDVVTPSPGIVEEFARFRFSLLSRLKRRLLRRTLLPHFWDHLADDLEPRLRRGNYDVAIGRGQPLAYVLTRGFGGLRVLDMANILHLEDYHAASCDINEIGATYEKELELFRCVDAIVVHHEILERFFREHVFNDPKVMTVRMGCYVHADQRRALYRPDGRIVYAGSYYYMQDPYLLSLLSGKSPHPIDCYGPQSPNRPFLPFPLNYRGYVADTAFLADYQAGLITVSADRLRRHSPSTKFAYYFAAGLPVLFPEWMVEGHTYGAAIPFTEADFGSRVQSLLGDQGRWTTLSELARETALTLSWDRVLLPLLELLQRHKASGHQTGEPGTAARHQSACKPNTALCPPPCRTPKRR